MKSLETELEVRKYLKILSSEYRIPPIQFPIIPLIPARVFPGLSAKSGKNSFNFQTDSRSKISFDPFLGTDRSFSFFSFFSRHDSFDSPLTSHSQKDFPFLPPESSLPVSISSASSRRLSIFKFSRHVQSATDR